MSSGKKIGLILSVLCVAVGGAYYFKLWPFASREPRQAIEIENGKSVANNEPEPMKNTGPVSPISGLPCDNWNRRPVAVMQPADVSARPAAGFSEADMVFEMPVVTASITRLMAVYVCGNPDDVGSMRSARHDYIALAKGLDAIFVHWGGSHYAIDKLKEGVIDDMNCNNDGGKSSQQYCYRKPLEDLAKNHAFPQVPPKGDDTGYAKFSKLLEGAKAFGYRMTNNFTGYPHQNPLSEDQRTASGHLRVAFAGPFAATYDYDRASNTYLRTWGGVADMDRNNGKRIAPSNIVVVIARSSQIIEGIQYNNVQIGDPWYDDTDSGDAYYYMNGQEMKGTWKKDKSSLDSKLTFFDKNAQEVKFIPGQIWVEVLEPGQGLSWEPAQ